MSLQPAWASELFHRQGAPTPLCFHSFQHQGMLLFARDSGILGVLADFGCYLGQAGWSCEQAGLGEDVPACGTGLELENLEGPSNTAHSLIPWFCDSIIIFIWAREARNWAHQKNLRAKHITVASHRTVKTCLQKTCKPWWGSLRRREGLSSLEQKWGILSLKETAKGILN